MSDEWLAMVRGLVEDLAGATRGAGSTAITIAERFYDAPTADGVDGWHVTLTRDESSASAEVAAPVDPDLLTERPFHGPPPRPRTRTTSTGDGLTSTISPPHDLPALAAVGQALAGLHTAIARRTAAPRG